MQNYIGYIGSLFCFALVCCGDSVSNLANESLEDDIVIYDDEESILGTFPYGELPPEVLEEMGSVDKARAFIHTNQDWVYLPTHYGTHGTMRCPSDPATWDSNCRIPYDRHDRLFFDPVSCATVPNTIWIAATDAVQDIRDDSTSVHGWNFDRVYNPEDARTIKVTCNPNIGVGGSHDAGASWFCWDLPGYPKDLCFFQQNKHQIEVGLHAVAANYGTGATGYGIAYNMMKHEAYHSLGWGHCPHTDHLMYAFPFHGPLKTLATDQLDNMRNFRHGVWHGAQVEDCNWLWGDPLGDACPNGRPF